jgi:alpha-mannosidase
MGGYKYPAVVMDRAWKTLLLNQFHDILPGSSIHRVYEEAERDFASVIATAGEVADKAAAKITHGPRGVTVLNSLNWPRTAMVALPRGYAGATDIEGEELVTQEIDGCTYAEVTVPPCGWTTITPVRKAATEPEEETVTAQANLLENDQLRVRLNRFGEITSIFDKAVGRELAAGACNRMLMYKDVPSKFDAWDIDSMYPLTPVELRDAAEVEVVSQGPLAGRLRVRRKLNESWMTQEITLRRGSRRVDFRTCIDWRERHKMLKVGFRVNYHANEAIHEIQFGHIRRPNHKSRPFDADRFEVSNHKWSALAEEESGFAVLNDCKYGLNVLGDAINLTLLRSPMAPDMTADLGEQEFTYSFYAWNGSLAGSGVVHESYALNVPVRVVSGSAGETSMLSTDAPNIIVEALKPAEDGSGDVVVRLYESMRTRTVCTLRTHLPAVAAEETDMLEQSTLRKLRLDGGEMELEFRPFEIKTIRLRMKKTR